MKLKRWRPYLIAVNALLALLIVATFAFDPYSVLPLGAGAEAAQSDSWIKPDIPAQKPFSEYRRLFSGNALFRYGLEEQVAIAQRDVINDYQYAGMTYPRSGGVRCYLRNVVTRETIMRSIGDTVGDFRITDITKESVVLDRDGETFELKH